MRLAPLLSLVLLFLLVVGVGTFVERRATADGGALASWAEAKKGKVSGRLTFSHKRPAQEIVIYLEPKGAAWTFEAPAPVTIRQQGARFEPPFNVIVTGQKVTFLNDEVREIDHNVYTLGAEEKDFDIFGKGESRDHVFAKPGEVYVHCSIHKFMDGKIFVAPVPAFDVIAGTDETFEIDGVAAGSYVLRTYQRAKRFHDAEIAVTVTADKESKVTVEMNR